MRQGAFCALGHKLERGITMTIHRNTTYIKYRADRNSNVYNRGDIVEVYKDCGGWHGYNTFDGTRFCTFASTIRTIPAENVIEQDNRVLSPSWKLAH